MLNISEISENVINVCRICKNARVDVIFKCDICDEIRFITNSTYVTMS